MATSLLIRIEDAKKVSLARLAKREGTTVSGVVRNLIDGYLEEKDITAYADDLWRRIGKTVRKKGLDSEARIDRFIHEARRGRR